MGVFLTDYFKCPPSELNFLLLCFAGYWPLRTKRTSLKILYSIYSFLCSFSIISMSFIQILDLYLLRNDKINLVKNLCASSITFACVGKYVILLLKVDKIKKLQDELNDFVNSFTDPEDVAILKNGEKQILRMTQYLYGLSIPCVIVWMLYPGLESSHERRVPFPYRMPIDFKDTPYYEIVYTYQSMSMVGFLINILSTDLVFCGFVIRINAQMDLIAKNIRTWLKQYENNNLERIDANTAINNYSSIKETINHHQKVFQEINQLQEIYRYSFLIHFIGVVMQVGAIVMEIVVVSKGFKLQVIQRMLYGACGLVDTFLLCYFGTRLEEESTKLGNVIYETNWHELSPKMRKSLIMIMIRSKRPPILKVSGFFLLNLSTFLEFLKLSYNITALLYHVIRKEN